MKRHCMVVGLLTVALTSASAARADERAASDSPSWLEILDGANKDLARDSGELQRATQGLKRTPSPEPTRGLGPRTAAVWRDAQPRVTAVLPLQRLPRRGQSCATQPRLEGFVAGHVPYPAEPFAVCLQLARGSQRIIHVRTALVTGRGLVVGKADAQIDFGDRTTAEYAAFFGSVKLPEHGSYRYVVDIDGVRVVNRPLFTVRPVVQPY